MKKPTPTTLDDEKKAVANRVAQHMLIMGMAVFGDNWAKDPAPPSADLAEVTRCREQYAAPVAQGMLLAAMLFVWKTAPPRATAQQLQRHIHRNVELMLAAAMSEGQAGEFWAHVANEPPPERKFDA